MTAVLANGCLDGRTAIVTGGGTGIGRATAIRLAQLGCAVAVAGRRAELLEAVVSEIETCGGRALALPGDLREPEVAAGVVDRAISAFERVDILVNNAGGQFTAPAETVSLNGFRAVMRLNLDANWELTRLCANASMLPRGYGKVISIVLSPRRGIPGMFHSSAARAAVESMTRTLASEWGGRGVRVCCIAPGSIDTEGLRGYGVPQDAVASTIPLGRLGRPEEVAELVAFVSSPAGDFITGTTLVIDGGVDNIDLPVSR